MTPSFDDDYAAAFPILATLKERREQLQQRIDTAGLTDAVALLLGGVRALEEGPVLVEELLHFVFKCCRLHDVGFPCCSSCIIARCNKRG